MEKTSTPDYAGYIMVGYAVYIILFSVVCEIHDDQEKRQLKGWR